MALIKKDGFDYWGNIGNTPVNTEYTISDTSSVVTTASYSPLGGAPIYGTGKMLAFVQNAVSLKYSFTAGASFVHGFHFRINGNDQAHPFLEYQDSGTNQLKIVINTSYYIEVYRNTTLLGTSSSPLTLDRWYFLEIKFTINNSTGAVQIKVDETSVLNLTSQDTQNTGTATVDSFTFFAAPGNYSGREMGIDNMYFLDTTGGSLNDFLGEVRIIALAPNAAGNAASWTPLSGANYAAVDDMPHDADSTYVESSTSGHYDTYNCAPFTASGTIHAFSVISLAKKTDVGAVSIKNVLRRSGTNYDGSSITLGSTYVYYTETHTVDPSTTTAWTASGIDAAEIGIKLV